MKRLVLITIVWVFLISDVFSQSKNVYISNISSGTSGFTLQKFGNQQKYEPFFKYLKSEFEEGSMTLFNSTIVTSVSFRYDITNDRMEMKSYINPEAIDEIHIGRLTFVYSEFEADGESDIGYFEIQSTGNAKLLLRRDVKRQSPKEGLYGYEGYQMIILTRFIKFDDKPAVSIHKKSNNEIISLFPDNNDSIKAYVKKQKLKLKKDDELIECLKYYSSLEK